MIRPILILIRGNSGSGKTTLANSLQSYFGSANCLLLHQDQIRREILHASDHVGTPAVSLIEVLIKYGLDHYQLTILEGILRKDVYGDMLSETIKKSDCRTLVYYLESSFEETLVYNQTKKEPFAEKLLRHWWRESDYLDEQDIILKSGKTDNFFQKIVTDINNL